MTSAALWVQGARPRTLGAAVAPVLVGTSAAVADADGVRWGRAALAMVVALALQVGVNYANDYSDGVRGTDKDRKGPVRLTATGLATPGAVKRAAFLSFGVAAVAGLVLSLMVDPWLLLVGVAAIAAAWLYTGGPKPYGYLGLGEVMVLVFFGFVATVGSAYVQVEYVPGAAFDPLGSKSSALPSRSVTPLPISRQPSPFFTLRETRIPSPGLPAPRSRTCEVMGERLMRPPRGTARA